MNSKNQSLVCVRCFTFNHAPYIEDAMDGFCMQQTNFPFVCVIVDDASTDGEPEIIRSYMTRNFSLDDNDVVIVSETDDYVLTFAQHKTNENCFFAVYYLKYNHYSIKKDKFPYFSEYHDSSKYTALCEGDDYWIDPNKLQMQADFMESHQDYVLCHTDFNLTTGGHRNHRVFLADDDCYFPQSFCKFSIGTLTTFFRVNTLSNLPRLWEGKGWPMGDLPLWIELSHEGRIKFFNKPTACYRILRNSASHGNIEKELAFNKAVVDICNYYADYYGIEHPKHINDNYYAGIVRLAYVHKNKTIARESIKKAMEYGYTTPKMWFHYIATIIDPIGWLIRRGTSMTVWLNRVFIKV